MAVYLADLALVVVPDERSPATAVVEAESGDPHVVAVNAAARAAGVVAGMKATAALALSGSLRFVARSVAAERAELEKLAETALRLTPTVCLEPPQTLLAEIGGSLRLFGGIEPIEDALLQGPVLRHRRAYSSVAPTALAARWLARAGGGRILHGHQLPGGLARVNLAATRWPASLRATLAAMGIRTVGDCLRLPRGGFARRAGERYLLDLDRALGRQPEPVRPFLPAERWHRRIELSVAVSDTPSLVSAAERLMAELSAALRRRQARIDHFDLVLEHAQCTATTRRVALAEPVDEESRLLRLASDQLERMALAAPVIALGIVVEHMEPARAGNAPLFAPRERGSPADPDVGRLLTALELLERLQGRFGTEAVYRIGLVSEHRPERAWNKQPGSLPSAAGDGGAVSPSAACRPLWLLPSPLALAGDDAGGPFYRGPLRLEPGPERIETGWWDGDDVARDYFFATSAGGQRLWVYRERLAQRRWYLHGVFG